MVIGNASTEMLVFESRERVAEEERETIVQRFEAMRVGIALQVVSIVGLPSRILGGTIGEYLSRESLLLPLPKNS